MPRDEEALREYAERTAAILAGAGFPRMAARVLMTLMVADDSLTAAELSERLGASAAAISGAVRYMQTMAMVIRVPDPGTRRDRYVLPQNAWYEMAIGENRLYDAIISTTDPAIEAAGGKDASAGSRLAEMVDFLRFIQRRLPQLLTEWNAMRSEDRSV